MNSGYLFLNSIVPCLAGGNFVKAPCLTKYLQPRRKILGFRHRMQLAAIIQHFCHGYNGQSPFSAFQGSGNVDDEIVPPTFFFPEQKAMRIAPY